MNSLRIDRLCIIGLGSIGGSLALALRRAGAVGYITGVGRNTETLGHAVAQGVIDEAHTDIAAGVFKADMVVVATPLGAMRSVFAKLKEHLGEQAIFTDVGSAKQQVIQDVQNIFGQLPANFVAGHPIAGTEKSGVHAAVANLFERRRVILTPHAGNDPQAVSTVRNMWQACGAEVIEMQAVHHDEVLAATSHLPHMLAYALVDTLARMDDNREIFDYAAGGFRDFTRIASSDPQMWHDICVANREQLTRVLHAFNDDLQRLTQAIESADGEFLKQTFMRAKSARDKFCG